jgi:hypothetical protein
MKSILIFLVLLISSALSQAQDIAAIGKELSARAAPNCVWSCTLSRRPTTT